MEDEFVQAEEQNDLLKFDKRAFLLSLIKKIPAMLLIPSVVVVIAGVILKFTMADIWQVRCVLLYQEKNVDKESQIPYLYQNFNFETILESVAVRSNMEQVREHLGLEMSLQQMYGMLKVARGRKSNYINIMVTGEEPETLIDFANTLAEVFIENYSSMLNKAVYEILDYYQIKQREYAEEIEMVREKIEGVNTTHSLTSVDTAIDNKHHQISNLEVKILEWQINMTTFNTKIRDIEFQLTEIPEMQRLSYSIKSSDLRELEDLKQELDILRKRYTDKNPKVQQKLRQYEALKEHMAGKTDTDFVADEIMFGTSPLRTELELDLKQYQYELNSAQKALQDYQHRLDELKAELNSLNALKDPYNELKRREDLALRGLDMIEDRLIESRLAIESNVNDFKIIERAVRSDYPVGMSTKVVVLAVGFLAFAGTVVLFAGLEFLDNSIKSKYDLEEVLHLQFLGEVPDKDTIRPNTYYSQLQILYGQLKKQAAENDAKIITFGSMERQTGKSFVICELISLLKDEGKKILWIDSIYTPEDEIQEYVINKYLYSEPKIGSGKVYKYDDGVGKLYFHVNDSTIKNVLKHDRLVRFLKSVRGYDYVFWELFKSGDNMQLFTTLADASDILVLIARFNLSRRNVMKNALGFLEKNSHVPICGVLTDIPEPYFKVTF